MKESLDVKCRVMQCRLSGRVIIVKLKNEEEKREIMRSKNKLSGGNIFIENPNLGRKKNTGKNCNMG